MMLIKHVGVLHAQALPNFAGVGIICRLIVFAFSLTEFLAIFAEVKGNFGT
jgi:hypothetical protein